VCRNLSDGRFEVAGPEQIGELANVTGFSVQGIWADADNDGQLDIIADMTTGGGGYRLFRNTGNGMGFTDEPLAPARQFSWVQSAPAVGDFNNDGYPDVFIVYPGLNGRLLANFGLGDATMAELVRIEWPSGAVQELTVSNTRQFALPWQMYANDHPARIISAAFPATPRLAHDVQTRSSSNTQPRQAPTAG
jgi:hypothetical protein